MAWVLPVIEGVMEVMSIVTFIQFIEEEAIQTASLGAWMAIRAKHFPRARYMLYRLEHEFIYHLEVVNTTFGWLAPYSQGCFYDFIQASKANVETLKELGGF